MEKLPSISKNVRCRAVRPTSSMSSVRKHFCELVMRRAGGSAAPMKYDLSGCMPAMVSSTEGSSSNGTSDADGRRRWSWAAK